MELLDINDSNSQITSLTSITPLFGKDNIQFIAGSSLIPHLGILPWDGHIYVSGATGAGKSYLIKQIVQHDEKNRKVYYFSHLQQDDPSMKELLMHVYNPGDDLKDSICIFDDYDDKSLSNIILERGRHDNTVAIVVNHKHREWRNTMKALNESKYVVLFPSANKSVVINEMRQIGLNKEKREAIIDYASTHGRYMILHQHAPNAIICKDTVVIL